MTGVWNIRLQLGSWGATVALPKSQFETAKEAVNAAAKSVIDLAEIPDMIPMSKESMLVKRRELYKDFHRFSGMPTLEYDEILEQIECQIIDIEVMLTETCEACGGEKLGYPCDDDSPGIHVPENGLCLNELEDCE